MALLGNSLVAGEDQTKSMVNEPVPSVAQCYKCEHYLYACWTSADNLIRGSGGAFYLST